MWDVVVQNKWDTKTHTLSLKVTFGLAPLPRFRFLRRSSLFPRRFYRHFTLPPFVSTDIFTLPRVFTDIFTLPLFPLFLPKFSLSPLFPYP